MTELENYTCNHHAFNGQMRTSIGGQNVSEFIII